MLIEPPGRTTAILAIVVCVLSVGGGCASFSPDTEFDAGFVASRSVSGDGRVVTRALGPGFEAKQVGGDTIFEAWRPFTSLVRNPAAGRINRQVAWPVFSYTRRDDDVFWWFLNVYGNDFDAEARSRYRFVVFPLAFLGRDEKGQGYGAIFPIGGSIHEYLGYDTLSFTLFPLYGEARKDAITTRTVLWPIVEWSKGSGISRWRVFPFYGTFEKAGRWQKRFVLWPLWTSVRYLGEKKGRGFLLFPLYGYVRVGESESTTVLPPFFRWSRGNDSTELNCPWPFVQVRRGEDIQATSFWPFWGRRSQPGRETVFFLWPIGRKERFEQRDDVFRRTLLLPFIQLERRDSTLGENGGKEEHAARAPESRFVKVWPLCSYQREGDNIQVRLLDLWPVKQTAGIDRNYAPFWTLAEWRRENGVESKELLWGLYRGRRSETGVRRQLFPLFTCETRTAPERTSMWSILGGLVGAEHGENSRRFRFLYFLDVDYRTD